MECDGRDGENGDSGLNVGEQRSNKMREGKERGREREREKLTESKQHFSKKKRKTGTRTREGKVKTVEDSKTERSQEDDPCLGIRFGRD